MWYDLVLFFLSTTGLAWGITRSPLLKSFREALSRKNQMVNSIYKRSYFIWYINEFFKCIFCTAIWTGALMYLAIYQLDVMWISYPFSGAIVARIVYKFIRE